MVKRIVLAYSGGLDTSILVHFLGKQYDAEVVACILDLGQKPEEIEEAKQRALANGAVKVVVAPALQAFCQDYLIPGLKARATYQQSYPLATALGRPLIAKCLVEVAHQTGADAVAHGCTGKGNDQVRIEMGVAALDPKLTVLAPQRTHPMTRPEVLRYAKEHGLSIPQLKHSKYSVDQNLWGRSAEGSEIEHASMGIVDEALDWTANVTPGVATVKITFDQGVPVALDGETLPFEVLVTKLNQIAGSKGIGRIDHLEDRLIGIKSREFYEAPGAMVLQTAHKFLSHHVWSRDSQFLFQTLQPTYGQYVYDGKWFSQARKALQTLIDGLNEVVTGTVQLNLVSGQIVHAGTTSPYSLYDEGLATYGDEDAFNHQASTGYLQIYTLPAKAEAKQAAVQAAQPTVQVPHA